MDRVSNVYGCKHKDNSIRKVSSSGGAFTALAESVLEQGGIVCGASFSDIYTVEHICIQNKVELYKLRGSKYVLSNISKCLGQIKEYLEQNILVLFSGTPCQVVGLHNYLTREYKNLYCIDFTCHGVPEPRAWNIYLKDLQNHYHKNVMQNGIPVFRNKNKGWYNYQIFIPLQKGKYIIETKNINVYLQAFLNNYILLPACYNCKNKGKNRKSDITLADFWDIDNLDKDFYDNLGISLMIINTKKGDSLFANAVEKMEYRSYNITEAIEENSSYYVSAVKPKDYEEFWQQISEKSFCNEINIRIKTSSILLKKIKQLYSSKYSKMKKG